MDPTSSASIVEIRNRIMALVKESSVESGGRVPTERALQEAIGVSRSRIRDALAALEVEGVVTRQVGSGTYLARMDSPPPKKFDIAQIASDAVSPAQLLEARLAFESGLQPLVVANATAADIKGLEKVLRAADKVTGSLEFEASDIEFHTRLASASHNDLMVQFAETLERARGSEWSAFKQETRSKERHLIYQKQHWAILDALKSRDSEAAIAAVRDHLRFVRSVLFDL
jgi:DNA-binding FadR family transcriptional regulator